jgi:Spy/CpxP family protein refolding chaperone
MGAMLLFATALLAQQTSSNSSGALPTVEEQLKVLTGKLDLTGDQQTKIKPILQELHDATQKLMEDKSLSNEERLAKVRPQRMKADSSIRSILNDDQKKKLDQYEQGSHGEMHGGLSGKAKAPQ